MNDLIAFLRARLDEDERTARSVLWDGSGNTLKWDLPFSATVQVGSEVFTTDDSAVADHIARHDPARVLAEVDAKRRIVDECAYWINKINASATDKYPYPNLAERGEVVLPVITLLALPYASHPAYRDEWRP
jgi:hypothetical protein